MSGAMAASRVETAYINGTAPSAASVTVARSEVFYEKLLQLHKDAIDGKHPRLSFAQAVQNPQSRDAQSSTSSAAVAHSQTGTSSRPIPGLNSNAASHPIVPTNAPNVGVKAPISTTSTPAKAAAPLGRNEPTDDPVRLKRIREQRQQLERSIAEYAKADEPILKNAREIPLNLLALAHAEVAPISGLKQDSIEDSFDEDSYYSSKANSWSTEHTEAQQAQPETAIVISDEDTEELYEPPSQVHGHSAASGQHKMPIAQRHETINSNGDWEPDWEEDEDYEPPAPAAFGDSGHAKNPSQQGSNATATSQRHTQGQMRAPEYVKRLHGSAQSNRGPPQQPGMVAVNQIPTPVAPQPSRISPLTTGNITQAMQSHISSIQQAQDGNARQSNAQGNTQAVSARELKQQRRLAKREAKAAAVAESSKKRKRGATPPGRQDKKGKRRAVDTSPDSFIKPEPASPASAIAAVPSRRTSIVQHAQPGPAVESSPYRPRSAYVSDQDNSPRQYRPADSHNADRMAMPPPQPLRRPTRDDQDLRRVASLQHARRPLSPGQEYPAYASSRTAVPRYEYDEVPTARAPVYREPSVRPSSVRPARTPSPRGRDPYAPRYPAHAPRPGQIVTDEFGNKFIAELVPAPEYERQSRRPHPDEYYAQYSPPRRQEVYAEDPYRVPQPTRAYSQMPEPIVDRRTRAYSRAPEPLADPRVSRAYSVHPAAAPQYREAREVDDIAMYERRREPSRYEEQVSSRDATYSTEYAPIARPYSTRPDVARREGIPEYRAPSRAPADAYPRRSEMAPPALPVMRTRGTAQPDDGYRYAAPVESRDQYADRRSVSYRY